MQNQLIGLAREAERRALAAESAAEPDKLQAAALYRVASLIWRDLRLQPAGNAARCASEAERKTAAMADRLAAEARAANAQKELFL